MLITYQNYKSILPQTLWEEFKRMADKSYGFCIIYVSGKLYYSEKTD